MCGRRLTVPGLSFIIPEDEPAKVELVPLRRCTELLLSTSPPHEQVRLRGAVTMLRPGSGFNLRDAGGSIAVQTGEPLALALGDVVEARGYAERGDFRPRLNAVEVRKVEAGLPPEPRPLDLRAPLHSRVQQDLVSLRARLLEVLRTPTQCALLCIGAVDTKFEAWIDGAGPPDLLPGAQLQLTGICILLSKDPTERWQEPDGFLLRLRGPGDIAVLAQPSWWTPRRLGWLAAGVAGLACITGLWVFLLQQQVRAQSAIIRGQAQLTATLDERQRIARELHDTLEQDLMGVTLLLDDTAERLNGGTSPATEPLTIARRLLRRSREESRSTIRDLRSVALEQLGLPAAIQDTLQPITAAAKLKLKFAVEGAARKLPVLIESSLLRIAHEGVSNAVKHARATRVTVRLDYGADHIRIEISDDGVGFAPEAVDARAGHFGLQGIRERANKIGGTVRIASQPGSGTTLRVAVPAPPLSPTA